MHFTITHSTTTASIVVAHRFPSPLAIIVVAMFTCLPSGPVLRAQPAVTPWQPSFQGIEVTRRELQLPSGQWQRGVAVRVDLHDPAVEPVMTAANGETPLETNGETTSSFLTRNDLSVAMNVHFFAPCCAAVDGQPKDLTSLAIADGELISPWERRMPDVLLLGRDSPASIHAGRPQSHEDVSIALAGQLVLQDGEVVVDGRRDAFATNRHPRSAIGLSRDGQQLFLLVIDGRRPDHSVGATLVETAEWLRELGASTGLNVDGGGSTTLAAAAADGSASVLNRVSGPAERVVGSNLGFRAGSR